MSFRSRPAIRTWRRRSRRPRTPTARPPWPTRCATPPRWLLHLTGLALRDAVGGLAGRDPLLVPLAGKPGTVAVLTTSDALDGASALNPDNRYPGWQQQVAVRCVLRLGLYRPGRHASRVRCPLLVLACEDDRSALPGPAVRVVWAAPRGELVRLTGGHYEPFMGGHEQAAEAQLSSCSGTWSTAPGPGVRQLRRLGAIP
jgi:uncharacterized protein